MLRKFTAKLQKLTPIFPDTTTSFSGAFTIDPEADELKDKKGVIYCVYDYFAPVEVDTLLIKKILLDVLHDSYYQSESVSPVQSLEQSIVDVRNKVSNISAVQGKETHFNILVGVLWGNVLYIVQYGMGSSYLMRDAQVKPINSATEGKFSVASGVVKNDDVVVLATHSFSEKYPPDELLSQAISISAADLDSTSSGMLLKFELESKFTKDEVVGIKPRDSVEVKVREESKENQKKDETVSSIGPVSDSPSKDAKGGLFSIKLPSFKSKKKPKEKSIKIKRDNGKKDISKIVTVFIGLLLVGSIMFTYAKRSQILSPNLQGVLGVFSSNNQEDSVEENEDANPEQSKDQENEQNNQQVLDEQYDVTRIDPEVFYDIALVEDVNGLDDMAVLDTVVVVSDNESGKLYVSSSTTPKFELLGTTFPGVNSLVYVGGDLSFNDNEGYKVYDPVNEEVLESYTSDELGVTSTYLGYVYSIVGDTLNRYSIVDDELSESLWGQSSEFSGADSFAVAVSIYVLNDNGLSRFTSGVQDEFEASGLDGSLDGSSKIVTSYDFENVYIADSNDNRIVVLDKDGNLVTQFKSSNPDKWTNIKSIGVSPDEESIFVLDGTKVYQLDINQE